MSWSKLREQKEIEERQKKILVEVIKNVNWGSNKKYDYYKIEWRKRIHVADWIWSIVYP